MPVCFRCNAENPGSTKYCKSCGAVLPQMAPTGLPDQSSFDVDEDTQYLSPTMHYPADELLNMAWAANDFLEEGDDLEPFMDAYEIVKKKFTSYMENNMETLREQIADDRARDPNDPHPKQLSYLHNKGLGYVEEGLASVEAFLAGLDEDKILPERLKDGVVKLVMANDHFCLVIALIQVRIEAINENFKKIGIVQRPDGELELGPPPPGSQNRQPPIAVPVGAAAKEQEEEEEEGEEE